MAAKQPQAVIDQVGLDDPDAEPYKPPDPNAEPPKPDRPDWLPDNFESPEDLAKSYREAQKTLTQAQQRASAAEETAAELAERMAALEQGQWQQPQSQDVDENPFVIAAQRALDEGDAKTFLAIQAQVGQAAAMQAYQQLMAEQGPQQDAMNRMFAIQTEQAVAQRYGDEWNQLKEGVGELLQKHPHLIPDTADPQQAAESISLVAEMVKARRLEEQGVELTGQQSALLEHQKRQAQGLHGSSGRPPTVTNPADQWMEQVKGLPRPYGAT